jgi:biotin synthase
LEEEEIRLLKEAGLDRLVFPLDAATEEVFERVKGKGVGNPFTRSGCLTALEKAVEIFGRGKVGSYLMVGLGETEREAVAAVQELKDLEVFTSLFAFTPIPGTGLENQPKPSLVSYRKIQLAHFLIERELARFEDMTFTEKNNLAGFGLSYDTLKDIVASGLPFQTRGCAGCNRPYYNEDPKGPFYNYPRSLTAAEVSEIAAALKPYLNGELRG